MARRPGYGAHRVGHEWHGTGSGDPRGLRQPRHLPEAVSKLPPDETKAAVKVLKRIAPVDPGTFLEEVGRKGRRVWLRHLVASDTRIYYGDSTIEPDDIDGWLYYDEEG